MKFKINNTDWTIENVDEATINNEMKCEGTLGVTIYRSQKIMLLKNQANIIKTLKHELTHVWLYEYGHNQNDDKTVYNNSNVLDDGIIVVLMNQGVVEKEQSISDFKKHRNRVFAFAKMRFFHMTPHRDKFTEQNLKNICRPS